MNFEVDMEQKLSFHDPIPTLKVGVKQTKSRRWLNLLASCSINTDSVGEDITYLLQDAS
ncbi:hypothetical protein ALT1000_10175 [Alteromonas macleodii]|tara:strand:+ start:800 stop:976 length:177 start_codon:yes stop_codon:yes gene_type:complete